MPNEARPDLISLAADRSIWERVFTIAPLVIVGSKEATGEFDLAPKHMAMPVGLTDFFWWAGG